MKRFLGILIASIFLASAAYAAEGDKKVGVVGEEKKAGEKAADTKGGAMGERKAGDKKVGVVGEEKKADGKAKSADTKAGAMGEKKAGDKKVGIVGEEKKADEKKATK
jgi:hypothetical protein